MKAVGIIAEYNPLHNGHVYHIEQASKLSGCEAVVVAMSGNYVQRGEPAITDKWTRARMALQSGADLVVEIPTVFCLGNASQYAAGGVGILEALPNVSHIAFGSECGDESRLRVASEILKNHHEEIFMVTKEMTKEGLSYPAARARALGKIAGRDSSFDLGIFESPNDILAIEYLRAASRLVPIAIKRLGAGYRDGITEEEGGFQSASAIRKLIELASCHTASIDDYLPESVIQTLSGTTITFPSSWYCTLKYTILRMTADEIDDCPSGGEGLGNLMKAAIRSADSWEDFIMGVKSKRYTYTRISRLCMQAILGITRADMDAALGVYRRGGGYIRILGFSEKGRALLAEMKRNSAACVPILTNINKEAKNIVTGDDGTRRMLEIDIHASDIYNLITGRDIEIFSDHRVMPMSQ